MTASYALNAIFATFPRIRLARPADVPAIRELHAASLRGLARGHYDVNVIETFIAHVKTLDEKLIDDGTYFVAEAGGRVVGAGGWSTRTPGYLDVVPGPAVGRSVRARIHSVFVHPDHARIGLGRCLMARSEGAVRAAGHREVALDATLSGVPLYVAMGYRNFSPLIARLPGGDTMTFMHMRKEFARVS